MFAALVVIAGIVVWDLRSVVTGLMVAFVLWWWEPDPVDATVAVSDSGFSVGDKTVAWDRITSIAPSARDDGVWLVRRHDGATLVFGPVVDQDELLSELAARDVLVNHPPPAGGGATAESAPTPEEADTGSLDRVYRRTKLYLGLGDPADYDRVERVDNLLPRSPVELARILTGAAVIALGLFGFLMVNGSDLSALRAAVIAAILGPLAMVAMWLLTWYHDRRRAE